MEPALQVALFDRRRKTAERSKGQQIPNPNKGGMLVDQVRPRPGGERSGGPVCRGRTRVRRQDAEPLGKERGRRGRGLLIGAFQKPEEERQRFFGGPPLTRSGKEPLPEDRFRPGFAAPKKRPLHPPFIVLGPRERQGQKDDIMFVLQLAGADGQVVGPIGVVLSILGLVLGDGMDGLALAELKQVLHDLTGETSYPRLEFVLLFKLGDLPPKRILFCEQ